MEKSRTSFQMTGNVQPSSCAFFLHATLHLVTGDNQVVSLPGHTVARVMNTDSSFAKSPTENTVKPQKKYRVRRSARAEKWPGNSAG